MPHRILTVPRWGFTLLSLVAFAAFNRLAAERAAETRQAERQASLREMQAEMEAEWLRQLIAGGIWEGALHEDLPGHSEPVNPIAELSAPPRNCHLASVNTPLDANGRYLATFNFHECRPASRDCSTGGTIYVVTRDKTPVLSCSVSLLKRGSLRQGHYTLAWLDAWADWSLEDKQALLDEWGGPGGPPDRDAFLAALQRAYGHIDADRPADGDAAGLSLCRNIFRAIAADAATPRVD